MSDDVTVHHGDALDVLATMPDASVDAVCTDPPYSLGFMNRTWDTHDTPKGYESWCYVWALECLRLLKSGGHLLAFGGSRTFHRLACAIEDAGFEIRDTISWLYGSGFPKSLDVSKAIDRAAGTEREVVGRHIQSQQTRTSGYVGEAEPFGAWQYDITAPATDDARRWQGWGTALKPAWEPIIVARKPLAGTVAANVLAHGTGALNIDGCRVSFRNKEDQNVVQSAKWFTSPNETFGKFHDHEVLDGADSTPDSGRWPANVVLDEDAAAQLDRQSGTTGGSGGPRVSQRPRLESWRKIEGRDDRLGQVPAVDNYGDTGGASRFYYTAKAAPDERPRVNGIAHPTVKPLDLMRWLVRLVTPPGGLVLDPFAGSGTTGEACLIEGLRCVLIEREADYLPLIHARLSKPIQPTLGATP